MKKTALLLSILLGLPLLANANVSVNINTPGVSIHIGDQDKRGYFWDGYDWRSPSWWQQHHNRRVGTKGPHGYWNGNGWQAQHPGNKAPQQRPPQHDNKPQHTNKPQQQPNHDQRDNHNGQPIPPRN